MKKEHIIVGLIFIFVLALRLFFAYQSPYFSQDAYLNLREADYISNNGIPFFNDESAEQNIVVLPAFHYVLSFFDMFMPLEDAAKIIPNIFAALLVMVVFLIVERITRNSVAAIISSLLSGFIPLYYQTVNNVSEYTLFVLLFFLSIYFFFDAKDNETYLKLFVLSFVLLCFTNSSVLILSLAFPIFFLLARSENIKILPVELELYIFSLFFSLTALFYFYKGHIGTLLSNMNLSLSQLNIGTIVYGIYTVGLIPLILGIYVIFRYFLKNKMKHTYLLTSIIIVSLAFIYFNLVNWNNGLIIISVSLIILSGIVVANTFENFENLKFEKYHWVISSMFILLIVLTSIVPSIIVSANSMQLTLNKSDVDMYKSFSEFGENSKILASKEKGFAISYYSNQKVAHDNNYVFNKNYGALSKDIETIYKIPYETDAISTCNKNKITYILLSNEEKKEYGIISLPYTTDKKCFKIIKYNNDSLYEVRCVLT